MPSVTFFMLLLTSSALASYRGEYDSRNLVEREEPPNEKLELVECPVCDSTGHWLFLHEECPVVIDNKRYKKCDHGTYVNEVCGNRLDCYRGPRERCTEKMEIDLYGQKCAPGLYCNKVLGECTGINYSVDSNKQLIMNPHRYRLHDNAQDDKVVRYHQNK